MFWQRLVILIIWFAITANGKGFVSGGEKEFRLPTTAAD